MSLTNYTFGGCTGSSELLPVLSEIQMLSGVFDDGGSKSFFCCIIGADEVEGPENTIGVLKTLVTEM